MKIQNKKKDDGVRIKDFMMEALINIKKGINNVEFELTTDNGETLSHKSINKVIFQVKRK